MYRSLLLYVHYLHLLVQEKMTMDDIKKVEDLIANHHELFVDEYYPKLPPEANETEKECRIREVAEEKKKFYSIYIIKPECANFDNF